MKGIVSVEIRQGPRSHQEDRYVRLRIDKPDLKGWLLAVMDGHVGKAVAELCAEKIKDLFQITDESQAEESLRCLVADLNSQTEAYSEGSTFSAALLLDGIPGVSVAVLGDSPVVVLDQEGNLNVSPEHNVRSNLKERKAAEQRGGIYADGYIWTDLSALVRGLQMSRALGDSYLGKVLSREPDIYTIHNPEWVLVASDGVFDPGHHNTGKLLEEIKECAMRRSTAQDVMKWAEDRGLEDNATALVWSLSKK
ncbi:MAG: protein serine/threonine phosphatase 2C family protein [Candidatus Harrisonbacteria bacterium]|nr:protein serine/threonine phosphatase 2C family protein [Candidatus Harrisonbacteria bacterium]